jgi:Transposase
MRRKRTPDVDRIESSRLAMQLGQQFQQIIGELLLKMPIPESFSYMEKGVRQAMVDLGNTLLTTWLSVQNDRYPVDTISCRCGAQARCVGMREGVLHTTLGRITYTRSYYLCDTCHEGTYPLDERLGLRPGAISADLERLTALTGAHLPFGHGSDLFETLTLVNSSPQTIDTATQAFGAEMEAIEADWTTDSQDSDALLRLEREGKPLERLYGGLDATKVHTDERRDDDDEGWRDLKMGTWFETDAKPPAQPDAEWDIQAKNITYYCDITEAERFGSLLWATGVQRQAPLAKEIVFVADGAEWIWNLVQTHYPKAVQIIDWFHAAEHLTPVAERVRGTAEEQRAWLKQMRDDLWEGRLDHVIAACAAQVRPDCANDPAQAAAQYFSNNRQRMDYPAYRAKGYQIGSGTMESGCKQVGIQRMKVPGATWDKDGARYVAKARAALLSDQWDMLAQRRVRLPQPA